MKNKKNYKLGFTLLELLVVVLIIGILAAIALPQYQLAIDKATFAKLQSTGVSLRDAYNEYILIHGNGTKNFEDLSVSISNDFTNSHIDNAFNCVSNSEMFCCMSASGLENSGAITCGKNDLSIIYSENLIGINGTETDRRGTCRALPENIRANRLCSSIGTYSKITNAWTPEGWSNKYKSYWLN